jgi:hypothetical protein
VGTQLAGELPRIQCDRVQLQQVMLNLIVNAIQSMSGAEDGNHELQISTVSIQPEGVCVAVRDTGHGLRPDSISRSTGVQPGQDPSLRLASFSATAWRINCESSIDCFSAILLSAAISSAVTRAQICSFLRIECLLIFFRIFIVLQCPTMNG